jgi:hypothetical protein
MRVTLSRIAAAAATATVAALVACQDTSVPPTAPTPGALALSRSRADRGAPTVRITSPTAGATVARGTGRVGAGVLTGGSAFAITVETVTSGPTVPAREGINIRNAALLGQPNPNFPGFRLTLDADLITPDGTIIPAHTDLANLFNVLGTDDTPGDGVTLWAGWHFLESFPEGVKRVTITAEVRDALGRVGRDEVTVKVDRKAQEAGQALTPAPAPVAGDGVDDADGPEVELIGPRDPSRVAVGTPAAGSLVFFQVDALDRSGAGIGVSETGGAAADQPIGLIRDGAQIRVAGPNRNVPGFAFTFDVPLRQPNGNVVPAGQNLAPLFDVAGSVRDRRGGKAVRTTLDWVVGGALVMPAGKTTVTVTARVTDAAGRTGSAARVFGVSSAADGQQLTPAP